jgi:hypothetical protein
MEATNLNKLIKSLENLIMMARLHRRFSMKTIPVNVEKRINVPDPYKKRY